MHIDYPFRLERSGDAEAAEIFGEVWQPDS